MTLEMLDQIEFNDGVRRDIWSLIFKTSVHVNGPMIMGPNSVAETLNRAQFFPLWIFSLINFHLNIFTCGISPSTENQHEGSNKDGRVLISSQWLLRATFVWSLDPVPSSIPVPSEAPGVFEGRLVSSSSSKNNHHSCCRAHMAHSSRVVHSCGRLLTLCLEFQPTEWCFINIQDPNIINRLWAGITSKNK